jgi:hypothetical protein
MRRLGVALLSMIALTACTPAGPPPGEVAPAPAVSTGVRDELTSGDLLPTSPPERLRIPALDADVPVTGLGLQPDGSMQVPDDAATVGWYTRAPTPGSLGPAILAGHVDYRGEKGTFARLSRLREDDRILVDRADGVTAEFAVTRTERHRKDRFPSEAVYGPIDHAGLRLITCGGAFDTGAGHYVDNIVVFAVLRGVSPATP